MKYTFYWNRSREEEKIIVMSHKDALKIIHRFKKQAEYCDSLFLYLSRKDVPSYWDKCYGHYFKAWDRIEFQRVKEA